ncbi:22605_t:CDS:1 [Dentiscutata erythropus]|uniref:22605_t:CDS:1 n=1 Tax=Dentiscutata erythropus TaxID=1348616 RepID=A0A9N9JWQ7_9GLOM|nr:22605_t:CDS:1 [Dentiscutata erythropus]
MILATNNKTSYPLVSLVTAVDGNTATYFVIYEENKVPTTECLSAPITCFVDQPINSPFTSLSQPPIMAPYGMNDTLNINPHLRFYVCEYSNNDAYSYKWAVGYAQVAYKLVFGLECAKFTLILFFGQCLANCHQYYLINFINDSIIWIMIFLLKRKYPQLEEAWNALDEAVEHKPKRHLLRIFCNTFLHSIPMIVLTIQSISFRFNMAHQPPSALSIVGCVFSLIAICYNLWQLADSAHNKLKKIQKSGMDDKEANEEDVYIVSKIASFFTCCEIVSNPSN